MKNLFAFVLAAIFALTLGGCPIDEGDKDGDTNNFSGTWYGSYGTGNAGLLVFSVSGKDGDIEPPWSMTFNDPDGTIYNFTGYWERSGNTLSLQKALRGNFGSASLAGEKLTLHQSVSTANSRPASCELGKELPSVIDKTSLKIKNESSVTITNVLWQNVSFASNQSLKSISPGTNATNTVQSGSGYIYFQVSSLALRTNTFKVVEEDEQAEFTFYNSTIVVEVNNPGTTKTLGEYAK